MQRKTQWKLASAIAICALGCLPGCGTRVILIPPGEPVRLRETIRDAPVWVRDAEGEEVAGVMDLPAGWYCLPDDPVD